MGMEKGIVTAFWEAPVILLLEFLDHGAVVNTDCYCVTLWHLKEVIRMKFRGLLTEKIIPLCDSAHPHTGHAKTHALCYAHFLLRKRRFYSSQSYMSGHIHFLPIFFYSP
jgi:hypothetical protein